MICPPKLLPLACDQSGIGYTAANYTCGSTTLKMQSNVAAAFPAPNNGKFFFVDIESTCTDKHDCKKCCGVLKVTAIVGHDWTVEPVGDCNCECFSANAKVSYSTNSYEVVKSIVQQLGISVQPPLKYDCDTGVLSLDCNYLNKCGCPVCD
jgi:hypothetical protein